MESTNGQTSEPGTVEPSRGIRRLVFSRWTIVGLGLSTVISIVIIGVVVYGSAVGVIRDAYAQEWVAGMVIRFMEWNGGAWPRSWEDLKEPYDVAVGAASGQPWWTFEELRQRVGIDFSADPQELAKAAPNGDDPPFRVIYLTSGRTSHWEGQEANQRVWDYLQERAKRPPDFQYPEPPNPDEKPARAALLALGAGWVLGDDGRIIKVNMASRPGSSRYCDDDLVHIQSLSELRELNLGYSNITDAGLEHIKNLPGLQTILLYDTKVTDAGVRELRRALPNCRIHFPVD